MRTLIVAAVLISGCAAIGPLAQSALQALAPIAARALEDEAARRGVEIDKAEAICVPLPEEHSPEGVVLVVCTVPELDE